MPSAKGKIIIGHVARLTFLDRQLLAKGERKITEQKFIMYVFRDADALVKTVQPAVEQVKGSNTTCEVDVYRASVTIGERLQKDSGAKTAMEQKLQQAMEYLNRKGRE